MRVQEVIIQNFRAKKGTAMAAFAEPPLEELLWTVAMARIVLGAKANIQVTSTLMPPPFGSCCLLLINVEDMRCMQDDLKLQDGIILQGDIYCKIV